MNKRTVVTLSIIIAVLILVAVIGVVQIAPDDYDGAGGIDYDPETYPNDYRGIKPSERDAYFATQTTEAP